MDSNTAEKIHHHHHQYGGGRRRHHHFFYVSPHCPHHRPLLQPKNHSPSCYFSTSYPAAQNPEPEPAASINPPNPNLSFLDNQLNQSLHDSTMKQDEIEEVEEEEEEEAIFVLTDEWRDFFAKSEAKRKLAKQAKKGKN